MRSAVDRASTLTSWDLENYNAGAAGLATPYAVENMRSVFSPADSPVRQGSHRALAAVANNFARETNMDELAGRAAVDPLEFRLRNLREPRMRAVLEAAASRFGWSRRNADCGTGAGPGKCNSHGDGNANSLAPPGSQRRARELKTKARAVPFTNCPGMLVIWGQSLEKKQAIGHR